MVVMINISHQRLKNEQHFGLGFGEHCGDAMTHELLDTFTQR